ncbi:MAG: addiction module protein [Victivallaceae bacterium]|nr:addiction module protein [Victivallaceae bacterium]
MMSVAFEQIERKALRLGRNERTLLGQELLISALSSKETEIEKAWYDEAERRLAAYKAGRLKTIPGEQVINETLARFSKSS